MEKIIIPLNNETENKDLWNIGLAELRENTNLLKYAVRIRLDLDSVRSQKEIDEATIDLANTATLTNKLLESVQVAMDNMNAVSVDLRDDIHEAKVLSKEAKLMKEEAEERIEEAKKAEKGENREEMTTWAKYGKLAATALISFGVTASAILGFSGQ